MGTTAQKGAYLNQTKMLLKDKINALGGSIDEGTTFREYANQLDGIYEAIPKTEYQSGSEVNLGKTIKGKLDFKKEYQAVEYIECDGGQHIDTGYIPNYNTKIEAEFAHNEYTKDTPLFGVRDSNYLKAYIFWSHPIEYDNNHQSTAQFNSTTTAMNNFTVGTKIKAVYDNQGVIYGGVNYPWPQEPTQGSPNLNLIILGLSNGGNIDGRKFSGKLWYFKIWDGDVLVRDFIPCYRISDGEVGLYDKVEGKFYTKLGSGTFTKGADVGSEFDEIVGIGQSSQETTQGYNLLPLNPTTLRSTNPQGTWTDDYTFTKDGITYKIDYDTGKIKVSGTATSVAILAIPISVTQGNTYRISGCPIGGGTSNYMAYMMDTTSFTQSVNDTGSGVVLQSASYTNYEYRIRIANGYTANNIVFEPMVIDGSTAKTFEKYTNGASPSPNWEQEVKCVAGRNIWGGIGTFNNANLAKTNADGTIDINITNTAITSAVTTQAVSFGLTKVLKRGTYTFTAENLISNMFCQIIKVNSETSGEVFKIISTSTKSQTFTITEDIIYFIRVQAEEGTTFNGTIKPQLEEGSVATPYLPYNTIDGTIRGNNVYKPVLVNNGITILQQRCTAEINGDEFSFTATGSDFYFGNVTTTGSAYNNGKGIKIPMKNNSQIAFLVTNTDLNTIFITCYDENGTSLGYRQFGNSGVYTVAEGTSFVNIRIGKYDSVSGTTYKTKVIMAYGDTIPSYEPYLEPETYQFSLGDYEFHGIGNYKDKILCDLENEKVYKLKEFSKYNLKDLTWTYNASDNRVLTQGLNWRIKNTSSNDEIGNIKCNIAQAVAVNALITSSKKSMIAVSNASNISFKVPEFSTLTEYTDAFVNTNAYIVFQIKEPELEEITGTLKDQIIAWCKAHSTNETTIIEMDGDLPLLIEVRGLKGAA